MPTHDPNPPSPASAVPALAPGIRVVDVADDLRAQAAGRIVGETASDPVEAGRGFLQKAAELGIDVSCMKATVDVAAPGILRQVVLGVVGAGRTAMVFVSGRVRSDRAWLASITGDGPAGTDPAKAPLAERVACLNTICDQLAAPVHGVRLAQALLEAREREALAALLAAGFIQLGELAYMRRTMPPGGLARHRDFDFEPAWPDGVRVDRVVDLLAAGRTSEEVDRDLALALERSYIDTLDCPELCGLREPVDVLASHRSVGVYDPSLWWLLTLNGVPEGCMLLSFSPEHDGVELVYLGLSPAVRGKGLGSQLLRVGVARLLAMINGDHPGPLGPGRSVCSGGLTCAVDSRNIPALRLYRRLGFVRFGVRTPFVRPLQPGTGG
jgi:GNAT superfamily N-acetyltransferase